MNPLAPVHFPTSSEADLDRLQQLAEQLSGFDERISLEWLDGAMTALAAGPRQYPVPEWRDRLLGDAWSRCFADPHAEREATAVLQARWAVLLRQLDPEILMEDPGAPRLAPVILEWDDEDVATLAEDEVGPEGEARLLPRLGELWTIGFFDAIGTFAADWPDLSKDADEVPEVFADAIARLALLCVVEPEELAAACEELHGKPEVEREDLVEDALFAVQDLRIFFVENAPRPETRRLGPQPGRNDPCPCGSGKKFKKCHGA